MASHYPTTCHCALLRTLFHIRRSEEKDEVMRWWRSTDLLPNVAVWQRSANPVWRQCAGTSTGRNRSTQHAHCRYKVNVGFREKAEDRLSYFVMLKIARGHDNKHRVLFIPQDTSSSCRRREGSVTATMVMLELKLSPLAKVRQHGDDISYL